MTTLDEQLADVLDNYATDLRAAINADTEAAAQQLKKAISALSLLLTCLDIAARNTLGHTQRQ